MGLPTFIARNPSFAMRNVRALAAVRRAMKGWVKAHPACAFCGKVGGQEVHHKRPVSRRPDLAADPQNFLTLCGGKRGCHFIIGHAGDWKGYVVDPEGLCTLVAASGIERRT